MDFNGAKRPGNAMHAAASESPRPHTITLVGGGASAIATLAEFCHQYSRLPEGIIKPPVTIRIVNANEDFGRGAAYPIHASMVFCNAPVSEMSLRPGDKGHCINTLNEAGEGHHAPSEFLSRSSFGTYAQIYLDKLMNNIAPNLGITVVPQTDTVSDIERNGEYKLYFERNNPSSEASKKSKPNITSDQVFLTVGHVKREDHFQGLLDNWECYFSKMDDEGFQRLHPAINKVVDDSKNYKELTALVIGMGPSGIDALRYLDNAGWPGKIVALSKEKSLPWSYSPEQDNQEDYEPKLLTQDQLLKLAKEYTTGYSEGDARISIKKSDVIEKLRELVREEIKEAEASGLGGNSFLYSKTLEKNLQSRDLKKADENFVREACRIISFFRGYRAPPKDIHLIKRYCENGRLELICGEAEAAMKQDQKVIITYRPSGNRTDEKSITADLIINAAPFGSNCRFDPLINRLNAKGGLLRLDRETGALECGPNGELAGGLFAIGPVAKYEGEYFTVAGIQSFQAQAQKAVAESIRNMLLRCNPAPALQASSVLPASLPHAKAG
jgi:uncharacterized NAD(P)/FAD-binding protein YdhS